MIEEHHYQLGERQGVLLKVKSGAGVGYCDVHPWPELGDDPLEKQIDLLKMGVLTPLTQNALEFARLDAEGRVAGRSLFQDLTVPDSHFLIKKLDDTACQLVEGAISEGFQTFKVKLGSDLSRELTFLQPLLGFKGTKWRLDFNGSLTADKFNLILQADLSADAIEFCEDPAPHTLPSFPYPTAVDWEKFQPYDYRVVKPAVDPWQLIKDSKPLIFTTYLGHPLGQAADAFAAANCQCREVCGLLSHRVYVKNQFSEELSWWGPEWRSPRGTGLGFDEQLNRLEWKRLL